MFPLTNETIAHSPEGLYIQFTLENAYGLVDLQLVGRADFGKNVLFQAL